MTDVKKPNKASNKNELKAYALSKGVEFPDTMTKDEMWNEVVVLMADAGDAPDPDESSDDKDLSSAESDVEQNEESEVAKKPSHYTIKVSRPSDTKLPDFTVNANGDNYQIKFGKQVKVPRIVVNILNDAIRKVPAHRDMETGEMVDESHEPEYSFTVNKEHFD